MHYVAALAANGPHQASAQGLAESLRALGGIGANGLGGLAMDSLGARALYGTSAACVGLALSAYLLATCCTPGSRAGQPCERAHAAGDGEGDAATSGAVCGAGAADERGETGRRTADADATTAGAEGTATASRPPGRSESTVELVPRATAGTQGHQNQL